MQATTHQGIEVVGSALIALLVLVGCSGGGDNTIYCSDFDFPADSDEEVGKGCGESFAVIQGHITSADPRWTISQCRASVQDEYGKYLLEEYVLPQVLAETSGGELALRAGCASGLTPEDVGTFVFTTTSTTGLFTFRIRAYGDNMELLQSVSADAQAELYPPAVPVELVMEVQ